MCLDSETVAYLLVAVLLILAGAIGGFWWGYCYGDRKRP